MSIFVHLSAYCDPELVPSLYDCIAKAAHPAALRFGVAWQHTPEDDAMRPFFADSRFRIIDIPAAEARGCCYARSRAQSLYDGEDYVLQLDSHHRFEPGWDTTLIGMMNQTGVERPCITAYAGSYAAETGLNPCVPWIITPKPFSHDGSLQFIPKKIAGWEQLERPFRARIASGHFFFAHGRHCRDVPYDPDLYFLGEELIMAVRSFTHGYDLFHPHRLVVHHQYHRDGRPKFWQDAPDSHRALDKISKERVLKIMGMEDNAHDIGPYGLGPVRSLAEFEAFVGIDFKGRRQHEDAIAGTEPPTTVDDSKMCVARSLLVHWSAKHIELPEDADFVAYIVESSAGKVLWRHDAHEKDGFQTEPLAQFVSADEPDHLIVWPHLKSAKWGPKKYSLPLHSKTVYSPTP